MDGYPKCDTPVETVVFTPPPSQLCDTLSDVWSFHGPPIIFWREKCRFGPVHHHVSLASHTARSLQRLLDTSNIFTGNHDPSHSFPWQNSGTCILNSFCMQIL